jgi:hypothetical protein
MLISFDHSMVWIIGAITGNGTDQCKIISRVLSSVASTEVGSLCFIGLNVSHHTI